MKHRLLALVAVAGLSAAAAAATEPVLQHDPFHRPEARAILSEKPSGQPVLRATLVSGERSAANLDGTIVPLGAEYRGHRLQEVHEFSVVLMKEGRRISIDLESQEKAP
jgi:hypothetical protein